MRIKFTSDYIGRETAMKQYHAGDSAEFGNAQALELIKLGVAKEEWKMIGELYDPPSEAAKSKGKVKRDKNSS